FPEMMSKIVEDLISDVHACTGKERSNALNSLYESMPISQQPLATLLLNPPRQSSGAPKISIQHIFNCVDSKGSDSFVAAHLLVRLLDPPLPKIMISGLMLAGRTVENTKRLLAAVLHSNQAAPKRRMV
ncbi:hypothetical protein PENTCL1PPCAC_9707, partial [Pristionchus entomophagus]